MIVQLDAGTLARILGHKGTPVAPGELGETVLPILDIAPYLLAGEAPAGGTGGDAFTLVGAGRIRSVVIPNPAAGADYTITVPEGVAWEPITFLARFIAAAVAATRIPRLVLQDNLLAEVMRLPAVWSALSGQTIISTWGAGVNSRQSTGGLLEFGTDWPNRMIAGPGWRFVTTTAALQAGDQWSDGRLVVREFNA